MPSGSYYYADVPRNKALKEVVAENVRAMMEARELKQQHVAALAKQKGHAIDQTTVGRIARAEIPTTVDKLDALAAALGVEPWHLLVSDLDPARLPKIVGQTSPDRSSVPRPHTPVARIKEGHRVHESAAGYRTKKVTR